MTTWNVTIDETISCTVTVTAPTKEKAELKAMALVQKLGPEEASEGCYEHSNRQVKMTLEAS